MPFLSSAVSDPNAGRIFSLLPERYLTPDPNSGNQYVYAPQYPTTLQADSASQYVACKVRDRTTLGIQGSPLSSDATSSSSTVGYDTRTFADLQEATRLCGALRYVPVVLQRAGVQTIPLQVLAVGVVASKTVINETTSLPEQQPSEPVDLAIQTQQVPLRQYRVAFQVVRDAPAQQQAVPQPRNVDLGVRSGDLQLPQGAALERPFDANGGAQSQLRLHCISGSADCALVVGPSDSLYLHVANLTAWNLVLRASSSLQSVAQQGGSFSFFSRAATVRLVNDQPSLPAPPIIR
jgi:hypothetical protein